MPYIKTTTQMKKITLILFAIISISTLLSSCGSTSKGGHCDAYGSVQNVDNKDLASK